MSLLTWDSEFFGVRIGRYGPDPQFAEEEAQEADLDCAYLFTDTAQAGTAEALGFRLMGVHLTLVRSTQASVVRALRPPTPAEVDDLEAFARHAFQDTRFRRDPCFDKRAVDDLYGTWFRNSYEGWAQCVRVAEREERSVGFVTVREQKIDLIAALHPNEGIGTELVTGAVNCAYDLGMPELRVTTQADNVRAVRLYERCGFLAEKTELVFHKWYR